MLHPFVIPGLLLALLMLLPGLDSPLKALWIIPAALGCTAALLIAYFLILYVISLFISFEKPQNTNNRFFRAVTNFSVGIILKLCRVKIRLLGAEKIPTGRWLLVSNHRSAFDPMIAMWALRRHDMAFITKPENLKIPIAGKFIHKCCHLPIDRQNNRSALKTILRAAELIKNGVVSMAIYPEGTRNHGPGLLPFRNGALQIAQRAGVPVVVTVLHNTDAITKRMPWRSTTVTLEVCCIIDAETVKAEKSPELGEEIRKLISDEWYVLENAVHARSAGTGAGSPA